VVDCVICRSDSGKTAGQEVGRMSDASFHNATAQCRVRYCYFIKAFDTAENLNSPPAFTGVRISK
jgi:hypothetical protein